MPLPPWTARNQQEKNAMRDWVFYQLDNFNRTCAKELLKRPIDPEAGSATIKELLDSNDANERVLGLAQLHALNVRLVGPDADRMQWKRKRGHPKDEAQYSSPPKQLPHGKVAAIEVAYDYRSRVRMAKLAVPLIRNILQTHPGGKSRRRPEDGFDVHEIVAAYFNIDVEAVAKKPSGKRKKRNRDKEG
jgi:hypothetical protein